MNGAGLYRKWNGAKTRGEPAITLERESKNEMANFHHYSFTYRAAANFSSLAKELGLYC